MNSLKLALDWTPNINHIGFFVAQERGYYRERGLDVAILDPSADRYATTPAKKVETGVADLALCPLESLISYRTKERPFGLVGIAALLQEDLSAIAVRTDRGVASPKDLDGKTYASYRARYEDEIVRQMVRNDGGRGALELEYPAKLGIWETVVAGTFDATWIFLNWEGVEAEAAGLELQYFKLKDFGIPYSYSPVIAASEAALTTDEGSYATFLAATKQGYSFAQEEPTEAISILRRRLPAKDKDIPLEAALARSNPYFGDGERWGRMDAARIGEFLDWIYARGLEAQRVTVGELIRNPPVE